jgi:pimeloyl-ACP methyl ester carboxylesterase
MLQQVGNKRYARSRRRILLDCKSRPRRCRRCRASSARLYWESKLAFFAPKGVDLPTGVSVFPDEIYAAPSRWAESAYPKLIHYNRLPKGGHFAAWEQPQMFSDEVRAAFRSLR